jgi:aminoglycoside 3-N-acetyltransferase
MGSLKNKELSSVITIEDIKRQLKHIGIQNGDVLEVHASLKSIGYVLGGANALLEAILETIGFEGTLVMSAQSSGNSEPAYFQNPPVDVSLYQKVRESIPTFKGKFDDLSGMGLLAVALQKRPSVYFSNHPQVSLMAHGKHAKWITQTHPLNDMFGLKSPLAKMVELKTKVLLIGVDFDRCTGMHLGEYLSNKRPIIIQGSRMTVGSKEDWVKFLSYDFDSDEFIKVGRIMEMDNRINLSLLGNAVMKSFDLEYAVRSTQRYFEENL